MKTVLHKVKKMFVRKKNEVSKDPFYDFFVNGRSANKKKVYNRALEGADADQQKILDEYQKSSSCNPPKSRTSHRVTE